MPDDDKSGGGLGALIPQVFYDVIARLIPGGVTVGVLALSVRGPERFWSSVEAWLGQASDKHPPVTLMVLSGFAISYTLSIAFLGLWTVGARLLDKASGGRLVDEGSLYADEESSRKYDFIKLNNAAVGNRITKLHAEIHMAQALALGFVLCFSINLLLMLRPFNTARLSLALTNPSALVGQFDAARLYLGLSLLAAIASCVGARRHFTCARGRALRNYADLLGYVGKVAPASPVNTGESPRR